MAFLFPPVSCPLGYRRSISFSLLCTQGHPPPPCPLSGEAGAYPRRSPAASALVSMFPFQPPFPTVRNFPFQLEAGSQTSILMSESLDGFKVAATRQKPGRSSKRGAPPRPAAGTVNAPGATDCAIVIVVSGSFRADRLSQEAAAAGAAFSTSIIARAARMKQFL